MHKPMGRKQACQGSCDVPKCARNDSLNHQPLNINHRTDRMLPDLETDRPVECFLNSLTHYIWKRSNKKKVLVWENHPSVAGWTDQSD